MATGGLTVADAHAFLDAGVRVVALGSALADPGQRDTIGALLKE